MPLHAAFQNEDPIVIEAVARRMEIVYACRFPLPRRECHSCARIEPADSGARKAQPVQLQ